MSFVFWLCAGFGVAFLAACLVVLVSGINGPDHDPLFTDEDARW